MDFSFFMDLPEKEFLESYWHKKPYLAKGVFDPKSMPVNIQEYIKLMLTQAPSYENPIYSGHLQKDDSYARLPLVPAEFKKLFSGASDASMSLASFKEAIGLYSSKQGITDSLAFGTIMHYTEFFNKEIMDLWNAFMSLEMWAILGIAMSFSTKGGGVGPHTDTYSSFFVQVEGRRTVGIGEQFIKESISDDDLTFYDVHLNKDFIPQREIIMEPGDVLYVPECTGHYFSGLEDNLCYIFIFQPYQGWHALNYFAQEVKNNCPFSVVASTNDFSGSMKENMKAMFSDIWVGRYTTQIDEHKSQLEKYWRQQKRLNVKRNWSDKEKLISLERIPAAKFCYYRNEALGRIEVFSNGAHTSVNLNCEEVCRHVAQRHPISLNKFSNSEEQNLIGFLEATRTLV